MASKVIGLDLGHSAIKATMLNGTYRGYEVVDFRSRALPLEELIEAELEDEVEEDDASTTLDGEPAEAEEAEPEPRMTLLDLQLREARKLLAGIDTDDATVVVPVRASQVSSWVVEVPFTQPKQINAILPGVLEERIPFDLDEVALYTQTLKAGPDLLDGEPGSRIQCSMARREELRGFLHELSGIGVDPRFLPVDAGVLSNLGRFLPEDADNVVLLDIGRHSTKLCALVDGVPLLQRTLDWGGRDIDAALESQYQFDPGDLEDYKQRVATLRGYQDDPEVGKMVQAVQEATRPLVALLRTTLVAFEEERDLEVEAVYLCGGGAKLRGLEDHLHEELGLAFTALPLPPAPGDVPEPGPEHAMAYALALRGLNAGKSTQVDFRIGEFAYRRNIQRMQRAGAVAVALVAVLVVIGMGVAVFNAIRLQAQDAMLMADVRGAVKESFPEVADSALVTTSGAVNIMQSEMDIMREMIETIDPANQTTAFDTLRDLSNAVPKDTKIDVNYLDIGEESIQVKAVTDKFETVDNIEAALKRSPKFAEAYAHNKDKARDGTTKFELTIPMGVTEEE